MPPGRRPARRASRPPWPRVGGRAAPPPGGGRGESSRGWGGVGWGGRKAARPGAGVSPVGTAPFPSPGVWVRGRHPQCFSCALGPSSAAEGAVGAPWPTERQVGKSLHFLPSAPVLVPANSSFRKGSCLRAWRPRDRIRCTLTE